jgi:hypothetical protein
MDKLTVKQLKTIYKNNKKSKGLKNLKGLKKQDIINELEGKGIKEVIQAVKSFLFFPSSKMPEKSQKIFEKYKSNKINKIEIYREPIQKTIQTFFNLLSLGKYNEAKKEKYDDLFHLYMLVTLDNNSKILIEKNENVYIRDEYQKNPDSEKIDIELGNENLDLDSLLYNTEKAISKFKFYQYNAKTNNCQDFMINILKSNGLDKKEYTDFIKQDLNYLFSKLPSWADKFTSLLTDLRAKISEIFGLGRKQKRQVKLDKFKGIAFK